MKVLILCTSENTGGAAVAAKRLMYALHSIGVEAKMLVRDKQTDDPHVYSVNTSWLTTKLNFLRFVAERLLIFLCNKFSKENLFRTSIANTGNDLSRHPLVQEADVIHLHWINQGLLSIADIRGLIRSGKTVLWTMHDMWAFTGICHYSGNCLKFTEKCFNCPQQPAHPFADLSALTWEQKKKIQQDRIVYVGCSKWITETARHSELVSGAQITWVPNPIDTTRYYPVDRIEARTHFNLDADKIYLLFGAAKLTDERKGAAYLKEACRILKEKHPELDDRIELLLMGKAQEDILGYFPYPTRSFGYLSSETELVKAYSAATLFVIPSLEDNLPNSIMESMACGTPCVGFRNGGIPEMIDHKENGYVADYLDAENLARGIYWTIAASGDETIRDACVERVKVHYNQQQIARRYYQLYEDASKRIQTMKER